MTNQAASSGEPSSESLKDEYALVCYIPGALGGFLDGLRTELVPECVARSHVTLLPPRPLAGLTEKARQQLREILPGCRPFVVELGEVSVFEGTRVIYLELLRGQKELATIHRILNSGALFYDEPFEYHPHVTLAQGPVVSNNGNEKAGIAGARWSEFKLPRTFTVDTVMFVQNGGCQGWLDLDELPVGSFRTD